MTPHKDMITLKLETIKTGSPESIALELNKLIDSMDDPNSCCSLPLRDYLEANYFQTRDIASRDLVFIGLLSAVYADIGRQMSPYIKESNVEKIETICENFMISKRFLFDLSVHWEKIVELLFSFSDKREW